MGWVGRGEGGMRACAARGVGPQEGAQRGGGGRRGGEHVAQQHLVCLVQRTRVDAPVDAPVERRHVLGVRVAAAACVCARAREACRGAAGGGAARRGPRYPREPRSARACIAGLQPGARKREAGRHAREALDRIDLELLVVLPDRLAVALLLPPVRVPPAAAARASVRDRAFPLDRQEACPAGRRCVHCIGWRACFAVDCVGGASATGEWGLVHPWHSFSGTGTVISPKVLHSVAVVQDQLAAQWRGNHFV